MAEGLGFIEFSTGDVLSAAAANGYLASQTVMVFASAAARTSAIATPYEGMISYLKDTNETQYYSGSAWANIGSSAGAGLDLITTNTFSAVSSVSLNNIFTSTYTNYKAVLVLNGSADVALNCRLRVSGADNSSSNYAWGLTGIQYTGQAAYNESINGSLQTQFKISVVGTNYKNSVVMDIQNPQQTLNTTYLGQALYPSSATDAYYYSTSGVASVNTSYDGMTFYPASGTITGTYWIYGYKKA